MQLNKILNIKYPIIQAGMVWCSGWRLASAVSHAGALGVIGAGSMSKELLEEHIFQCKAATSNPFAVNLPLIYSHVEDQIELIIKHQVPIVITSAGNPSLYTHTFKQHGIKVLHVVSSKKFALKAQQAGVDAVIAEGFEAGGHNGKDETTTFCLIPEVVEALEIPVIAAGGISDGKTMLAAFALGAQGVQIGTRFAASKESSASEAFKQRILQAQEGDTDLVLKAITPVRMLKNEFYQQVKSLEKKGATAEELKLLLGKGRSKKGIFEGDLVQGELEIGQVASRIHEIQDAAYIVNDVWQGFLKEKERLQNINFL
jgi:enoyl-[acyl-carrier protein] reductase II